MYDIRIFGESSEENKEKELRNFVAPGDEVASDPTFMKGHGTYSKDGKLLASVAGTVQRVNKLYSVKPLKSSKYTGEIGDVVVGRIKEVQQRRWIVEVNARLDAVLNLSSVNLPGAERRIKTEEDELKMSTYMKKGDLVSAEVHSVFQDGALCLHARSLKFGKLGQGTLLKVPPSLISRQKTHFHEINCVQVILSNNGYVWISPTIGLIEDGGYSEHLECIPKEDRMTLSRVRNCIQSLVTHRHMLSDTIILYAYEASLNHETKDILKPEIMKEIVDAVVQRIRLEARG